MIIMVGKEVLDAQVSIEKENVVGVNDEGLVSNQNVDIIGQKNRGLTEVSDGSRGCARPVLGRRITLSLVNSIM